MSGRSRKFGKAVLELSLNDKVSKALKGVQARVEKIGAGIGQMGKGLAAVSASIVGPLAGAVATFSEVGDSLNKMSARTGVSVEALNELKFAAQQSGTSLDTVEKGIRGMSKVLLAADQGLQGSIDKLAELGLTVEDLAGKSPEQQFEIMAASISAIEDPSRRAAASMAVFGKAGSDMLPLFANGVEGMNALRQEARDLGIVMSEEDAAAAAALADVMGRLTSQVKAIAIQVGAAVAGPLTAFADSLKLYLADAIDWVKLNGELIIQVGKIGAVLGVAGTALIAVGGAFNVAALAVGGLTTALTFLLAHPVVAAIAAITAAVVVLWNEYDKATNSVRGLDAALNKQSRKRTDGDAEELAALATRFDQLGKKAKLSKAEQKEARKIIHDLRVEYGDLAAFVDRATGKIAKFDKTKAQLGAARGGQSILSLKQQIGLSESSLEVAGAEGASDADLEKRREALAGLREELARTQRIIADAKPITAQMAGQVADPLAAASPEPGKPSTDGKEHGADFANAFIDGARDGFGKVGELIGDSVKSGVELAEIARERLAELTEGLDFSGLDAVKVAADSGKNQTAVLDTRFAGQQFGGRSKEVNLLTAIEESNKKIAESNEKIAEQDRGGGLRVT